MRKRNESIEDFCEKIHQALYERQDFIENNPCRKIDDGFNTYCEGAITTLVKVHHIIDEILNGMKKVKYD